MGPPEFKADATGMRKVAPFSHPMPPREGSSTDVPVLSDHTDQQAIEELVGGRGEVAVSRRIAGRIVPQGIGPSERPFLSVYVGASKVGHLDIDTRLEGVWSDRSIECELLVCGGWYRSSSDKSDFFLYLDPASLRDAAGGALPGARWLRSKSASWFAGTIAASVIAVAALAYWHEPGTGTAASETIAPTREVPELRLATADQSSDLPAALMTEAATPEPSTPAVIDVAPGTLGASVDRPPQATPPSVPETNAVQAEAPPVVEAAAAAAVAGRASKAPPQTQPALRAAQNRVERVRARNVEPAPVVVERPQRERRMRGNRDRPTTYAAAPRARMLRERVPRRDYVDYPPERFEPRPERFEPGPARSLARTIDRIISDVLE